MNTDDYWAEVFQLVEQQARPSIKLVYKLYYDPETLVGTMITPDDLPGVFVVVDSKFIFNNPADYQVINGKITDLRPAVTNRLQTGGNVYYTLHNDNQFAVPAGYPGAQGWDYGRVS
jgi:hypothetical protein